MGNATEMGEMPMISQSNGKWRTVGERRESKSVVGTPSIFCREKLDLQLMQMQMLIGLIVLRRPPPPAKRRLTTHLGEEPK